MKSYLMLFGAGLGVMSAFFWFWSAVARITWDKSIKRRKRRAAKSGTVPNLGGVALSGNDLEATLKWQSSLSGAAAILSGLAILVQTASNYVH